MMLTGLDRVLRGANVRYREVPGWKSRTGRSAGVQLPKAILWHHTGSPAALIKAKNNPTTKYMTDGLGYPLAQLGLAWDGTVDIIAAGWCAHAGKGAYPGIPTNQGNEYAIGIEVEGTIGLTWSDAQLETAARLGAAFNREFGQLVHMAHYEWAPGRKTDPSGIPGNMPALRAAIKRGGWNALAPVASVTPIEQVAPQEEISMSAEKNIIDAVNGARRQVTAVYGRLGDVEKGVDGSRRQIATVYGRLGAVQEVVVQLAAGQGVTIDYAKVEAAAKAGAAEAASEAIDQLAGGVDVTLSVTPNAS